MELNEPRLNRTVFKMERGSLDRVRAEIFPGVGFREDRMTERAGAVPALRGIADFKNKFHALYRIPGKELSC